MLALALVAFAGCSKSGGQGASGTAMDINGVKVDIPKLQSTLATVNNPDVQNNLQQVTFGIRYADYMKAMMSLDKLAADPNLNDAQKKVVTQVLEQMKQVVNKPPPNLAP